MTAVGRGLDLEEHKLTFDGVLLGEVADAENGHELVKLLGNLLETELVGLDDDRHAREPLVLSRRDRERLDVKAAAGDHAGHAGENARLVLDRHGKNVLAGGV